MMGWRARAPTLGPQNWVWDCHKSIGKSLIHQSVLEQNIIDEDNQKPYSCCLGANHCPSFGIPFALILSPCMLNVEKDASSCPQGL